MSFEIGSTSIQRALNSLAPGGSLHLGFFGGEPLLEAQRIREWMRFARGSAANSGKRVAFNLTTNGTITHRDAWEIMLAPDLGLAVSFDGNPQIHDRHRRDAKGRGTANIVQTTICRLLEAGKAFSVIAVVRPDNLDQIPDALNHLYEIGVRQVNLSLDLWTTWTAADAFRLQHLIQTAAHLWRQTFSLNWFDAKATALVRLPVTEEITTCGFGMGEVAVAPSGRLYPCERVIGEDRPDHPLRLSGHALDAGSFLSCTADPFARCGPCSQCALAPACDTTCRCSNFIRTGDVNRPDGLLCTLNKATAHATAAALKISATRAVRQNPDLERKEHCYV